jgi:hypothetical protein
MIWGCHALTDRVVDSGQAVGLALQQPYSSTGNQGEPGANISFGPEVQQVKRCVPPCDAGHQHPDKEEVTGSNRRRPAAGYPCDNPVPTTIHPSANARRWRKVIGRAVI